MSQEVSVKTSCIAFAPCKRVLDLSVSAPYSGRNQLNFLPGIPCLFARVHGQKLHSYSKK